MTGKCEGERLNEKTDGKTAKWVDRWVHTGGWIEVLEMNRCVNTRFDRWEDGWMIAVTAVASAWVMNTAASALSGWAYGGHLGNAPYISPHHLLDSCIHLTHSFSHASPLSTVPSPSPNDYNFALFRSNLAHKGSRQMVFWPLHLPKLVTLPLSLRGDLLCSDQRELSPLTTQW